MAVKRYRVVAEDTRVLDYRTGEEFEFDFSEETGYDEAALLASGAVKEVSGDEKPEPERELTKEQLLARTSELGISSSSSMSTAEIKAAIEAFEAEQG
jgi:hypothetical protein